MKQAKKFSALLIVFMLIVSCFSALSIPVLAASGDTIYFDNSVTNFSTVYCYMWNDSGKNGEWPGVQMTQGSDGIWSCSVAGDYNKVIFNAGQGQRQSSDLDYPGNNKVAKAQGNYDKFDVSWSNYSGGNIGTECRRCNDLRYASALRDLCEDDYQCGDTENRSKRRLS